MQFTTLFTCLAAAALSGWETAGVILLIFVAVHLVLLYPLLWLTAFIIYRCTLVRNTKAMWSRTSMHDDPLSLQMVADGRVWMEENIDCKHDVHIVNDGLRLCGEYYDFGFDRAVIFIPGRTDSLTYSYYYAMPYRSLGYNVLCIDQRGHGESEGKYVTLGHAEHRDVLAWARHLHDERGVRSILLHGVCIGSACGLYAMISPECPDYLIGLVADGMYRDFYESYYLHMKELKKPTFIAGMINACMKRCTGYDFKSGPGDVIHTYRGPLLMLHGTADKYSLPARTTVLFDRCPSEHKKLVWFEGGEHSKLRVVYTEQYDAALTEFLLTLKDQIPATN